MTSSPAGPDGASGRDLGYAAAFTGLSPHTVRALARRRVIAHYRLGRRIVFKDEDLAEYMRRHRVEVAASTGSRR
jgi:excisionase family DNA binding protein